MSCAQKRDLSKIVKSEDGEMAVDAGAPDDPGCAASLIGYGALPDGDRALRQQRRRDRRDSECVCSRERRGGDFEFCNPNIIKQEAARREKGRFSLTSSSCPGTRSRSSGGSCVARDQ